MAESRLRTLSVDFAVQILNLVKFLKGQHERSFPKIKSCPVENIILLTVALLFWSILWIIGAVCEFFPLQKNFI